MVKQLLLVNEFEKFITATKNGKRCKLSGEKIRPSTIENYRNVLKLLCGFEQHAGKRITIAYNTGQNMYVLKQEKRYWIKFYREFSDFLYHERAVMIIFAAMYLRSLSAFSGM